MQDFVSASDETTGGRLARWLQPESVVDPAKSQLLFPGVFSATCLSTFGDATTATTANNAAPNFNAFTSINSPPIKSNNDEQGQDDGDGNKTEESVRVQPMARNNKGTVSSTVVSDGLLAGWPTILTLLTRDQYGRLVHVPNPKVN